MRSSEYQHSRRQRVGATLASPICGVSTKLNHSNSIPVIGKARFLLRRARAWRLPRHRDGRSALTNSPRKKLTLLSPWHLAMGVEIKGRPAHRGSRAASQLLWCCRSSCRARPSRTRHRKAETTVRRAEKLVAVQMLHRAGCRQYHDHNLDPLAPDLRIAARAGCSFGLVAAGFFRNPAMHQYAERLAATDACLL